MRILYLHQYFVPPTAPGGTRSYEFARRLIQSGHQVLIITSSARLPNLQNLRKTVAMEIDGIPVLVLPVRYSNTMPFAERLKAFLRFAILASAEVMRHRADVVFATSTPLTIAIPGIVARLRWRIPLVVEIRDLWPELPIAVGALRNPLAKALASALEWLAYRMSAHIVALSPGMAQGVMKRGIPAERVSVIPNGADIDRFTAPTVCGERIRQRIPGLGADQPLVLYAGAFGLINGVSYLVEIAAAMQSIMPSTRFLLIGGGAERDKVLDKARSLGLLERSVWYWEPLPKEDMPDVLAAATVATSLFVPIQAMWNNSANKFFDALAAGRPVVINYGGWQAELLTKAGAGIVLPANDPVRSAQLLASLLSDPARLAQAGQAARTLARDHFSRDRLAAELEEVLCKATRFHA